MKTNLFRKEVMIMGLNYLVARLSVRVHRLYIAGKIGFDTYSSLTKSLTYLVASS